MNKPQVKKSLVRPVSKTSLVKSKTLHSQSQDNKSSIKASHSKSSTNNTNTKSSGVTETTQMPAISFDSPELNTALKLARTIEMLQKAEPRKVKSVSSLPSSSLALDEKITRKLNVPYDHKIYRDLIPLEVKKRAPPTLSVRNPLPLKDKEPVLSDYFEPQPCKEFSYQVERKYEKSQMIPYEKHSNLRLYKLLQTMNECGEK